MSDTLSQSEREFAFWERWAPWRHGERGKGNFADFMWLLGIQRDFARFTAKHASSIGPRLLVVDLGCGSASLAAHLDASLREVGLEMSRYVGIDYGAQSWLTKRSLEEFSCRGLSARAEFLHHDLSAGLPPKLSQLIQESSIDGLLFTSSWGISYLPANQLRPLLEESLATVKAHQKPAMLSINMLTAGQFDRSVLTKKLFTEIAPKQFAKSFQSRDLDALRTLALTLKALPTMRAFGAELQKIFSLMPVEAMLQSLRDLHINPKEIDQSLLWGQTTCIAASLSM